MDAMMLAAGKSGEDFYGAFGTEYKCLVEVARRPILDWVLRALRGSSAIGRIVVIGPVERLRAIGVTAETLPIETGSYAESVGTALRAAEGERVLLIAADVPLVRPEGLDRYIADCLQNEADVCFPVVSWQEMQAQLPGARKTWYDLRDGKFTKGNAVVAKREALLEKIDRVEALFHARKKKQWAGLICQAFMSRLLGCAATRAEIEAALSAYMGLRLKGIEADPALAVDVDEVSDVAFVAEVILRRCRDGSTPSRAACWQMAGTAYATGPPA